MVQYDEDTLRAAFLEIVPIAQAHDWHPAGSAYALGEGQDLDMIILCNLYKSPFDMMAAGWVPCWNVSDEGIAAYMEAGRDSRAYRKGNVNAILMGNPVLYEQWRKVSDLCRYLKVDDKEKRIAIHRLFLDNTPLE